MSNLEESAFGLSEKEMDQIRYIEALKRRKESGKHGRKVTKFSDKLSIEAQIAMQLALEDTRAMQAEIRLKEEEENKREKMPDGMSDSDSQLHESERGSTNANRLQRKIIKSETNNSSQIDNGHESRKSSSASFSELFERNSSARMRQDLTDENYNEDLENKRPLGGGKLQNAMEIIEIINRDDPTSNEVADDDAIAELARTNSVDKCVVWMAATDNHQGAPTLPDIPEVEFESREMES